jgi:hypothetical protein
MGQRTHGARHQGRAMSQASNSTYARKQVFPADAAPQVFAAPDWDAISQRVDGEQFDAPSHGASVADALREVLLWTVSVNLKSRSAHLHIARRVIAVAWVTNPELFEGAPSLRQLCKRMKLNPALLSTQAAEVTRRFGIRNRYQAQTQNRKAQRENAVL